MGGAASVTMDGSMSNSFRNDQVSPFYVISSKYVTCFALGIISSLYGTLASIIFSTILETVLSFVASLSTSLLI